MGNHGVNLNLISPISSPSIGIVEILIGE